MLPAIKKTKKKNNFYNKRKWILKIPKNTEHKKKKKTQKYKRKQKTVLRGLN